MVPFTLIAWAEQSLDAGLATILNSTSPIFTFLLTAAITRHETVTAQKLFGVLAGIVGICLIVGVQALGGLGTELVAQIAIVAATICYAGAAIFSRGLRGLDPMAPAAGSLICGAAILILLSLIVDQPWTLAPSMSSVLALLGLAVFSTALRLRDLFPPDPDARLRRHHRAGLSARADRGRDRASRSSVKTCARPRGSGSPASWSASPR